MRLDKLAITAQEAFQNSMGVASDAESAVIQPIHLLKALLDADENNLAAIIKRIGADPAQLERNVNEEVERGPKSQGGMPMPMPGNDLMKTIDNAVKAAEKLGDSYATSEHLLIALSEDKGPAGRILNGVGITRKNIEAAYEELRGDTRVTDQQEKAQFEALEQYGQNLTGNIGSAAVCLQALADSLIGDTRYFYRRHATALSLCQKSGEYPASASGCSPGTYGSGYPGHGVRLNAAADYRAGHGRFPQRQMGMEDA